MQVTFLSGNLCNTYKREKMNQGDPLGEARELLAQKQFIFVSLPQIVGDIDGHRYSRLHCSLF